MFIVSWYLICFLLSFSLCKKYLCRCSIWRSSCFSGTFWPVLGFSALFLASSYYLAISFVREDECSSILSFVISYSCLRFYAESSAKKLQEKTSFSSTICFRIQQHIALIPLLKRLKTRSRMKQTRKTKIPIKYMIVCSYSSLFDSTPKSALNHTEIWAPYDLRNFELIFSLSLKLKMSGLEIMYRPVNKCKMMAHSITTYEFLANSSP